MAIGFTEPKLCFLSHISQILTAISRFTEPIPGMFVLIWMYFSWWFQIWSWNSTILTFFLQNWSICWPVVCTRPPPCGKHQVTYCIHLQRPTGYWVHGICVMCTDIQVGKLQQRSQSGKVKHSTFLVPDHLSGLFQKERRRKINIQQLPCIGKEVEYVS